MSTALLGYATEGYVQTALGSYIPTSSKGQPNGVAGLNSTGSVPSANLPRASSSSHGVVRLGNQFYIGAQPTGELGIIMGNVAEENTLYPIGGDEAYKYINGAEQLIKDTVGWSGKNLADSDAQSNTDSYGLTWTVDSKDKNVITVSGTPTGYAPFNVPLNKKLSNGTYILTGAEDVTNATFNTMLFRMGNTIVRTHTFVATEYNKPYEFTITDENDFDNILITLKRINNDVACSGTFKIMIRKADIVDPTYEPYAGLNTFPRQEQRVLGAKNLLPFPYAQESVTINGVTFTVNSDGTISTSGTCDNPNGSTFFLWSGGIPSWLDSDDDYILTGCPSGGSVTTYSIQYSNWAEGNLQVYYDEGSGVNIKKITDSTTQRLRIWIRNGVNADGLVFKPMIRLASDTDDTYAPYAMTNKEITNKLTNPTHWISTWGNYIEANTEINLSESLATKNKLGLMCGLNNSNDGMQFIEIDLTRARSQAVEYITFNLVRKTTLYYFILKIEDTKITIIDTNAPTDYYGIRRVYSD